MKASMNCREFEERISDYVEGVLDTQVRHEMEMHLEVCESCTELLGGVREVMVWGREFPVYEPAPFLASRIVAATPQIVRETWLETLAGMARWCLEPRTAMGFLTAALMLSWLGSLAGVGNIPLTEIVREPSSIYYRAEGFLNRAYGDAVQRYYRTPLVTQIQYQLQRMREIS